ncbi:MAG TPA: metallophosphoesterase [Hydrogenophaga sp.]|uniref:metallophosphoesterase n=1 Tax=Hydrogenophaga sp. TaxID=1904254 RepID=UPI002C5BCB0A|nr:metallophosphoesterase [Hydrogenophaga sp.]HMN92220.1 metallophosphoesterase [Hydrogenophaga sp.]HMP11572.1 metallophosphoesterase [Hydrogenophaga sp.]
MNELTRAYDLIGDIHGHAGKMEALLLAMGYMPSGRGYKAPEGRMAVFLGDLIDRGPQQLRVLEIARAMVESGDALSIMGNHEFNAIGYLTVHPKSPEGECYRPNRGSSAKCLKNRAQHAAFLEQVGEGSTQHHEWVRWFRSLPPFLDLGGLRAVHGCWDDEAVALLKQAGWMPGSVLSDELLAAAYEPSGRVRWARELLTCGLELPLSEGRYIVDKAGHRHDNVRVANWRHWAEEFHQLALVPKGQEEQLRGMEWPAELVISAIEGSPIFVGHHWFTGHPLIESPKLACLDWSAAADGPLVAYRWDGEQELSNNKLFWVRESRHAD